METPSSSSTLTWVHSGGKRGTSTGEVRAWNNRLNQSMMGNPANSTINLDTTAEEMEVLDLDQDLTMEETVAMEEDLDHPLASDKSRKTNH